MRPIPIVLAILAAAGIGLGLIRHATTTRLRAMVAAGTTLQDPYHAGHASIPLSDAARAQMEDAISQRDPEAVRRVLTANLRVQTDRWEADEAQLRDRIQAIPWNSAEAGNLRAARAGDLATLQGLRIAQKALQSI